MMVDGIVYLCLENRTSKMFGYNNIGPANRFSRNDRSEGKDKVSDEQLTTDSEATCVDEEDICNRATHGTYIQTHRFMAML